MSAHMGRGGRLLAPGPPADQLGPYESQRKHSPCQTFQIITLRWSPTRVNTIVSKGIDTTTSVYGADSTVNPLRTIPLRVRISNRIASRCTVSFLFLYCFRNTPTVSSSFVTMAFLPPLAFLSVSLLIPGRRFPSLCRP